MNDPFRFLKNDAHKSEPIPINRFRRRVWSIPGSIPTLNNADFLLSQKSLCTAQRDSDIILMDTLDEALNSDETTSSDQDIEMHNPDGEMTTEVNTGVSTSCSSSYSRSFSGATSYRERLGQRYRRHCAVSGIHESECEGAHIIPRYICDRLDLNCKYDTANGILLSRNLHTSFDNYVWTFDVWDPEFDGDTWVQLPVIAINNRSRYTIREFIEGRYRLPVDSLPYLYLHYQVFMCKNYREGLQDPLKIISSKIGDPICMEQERGFYDRPCTDSEILLDKRHTTNSLEEYLILYPQRPFRKAIWVSADQIGEDLQHEFERRACNSRDPDYI